MSKDKKITFAQVQKLMNNAYDYLEDINLACSKEILINQFGFTEDQWEKYKDLYLEKFGEETANYITRSRETLSKQNRR